VKSVSVPVVYSPERQLPRSLWERLRNDPTHAPEHIALAAAERHAPVAAAWVAAKRDRLAVDERALAEMAKRRHATLARFTGAATGVGGIVTMIPDLASLAWIQSRMVFFLAASYGYDPYDRMRPAELLVLQKLYEDPLAARAALDGVGRSMTVTWIGSRLTHDEALAARLTKMVGKRAVRRVARRIVPVLGMATNAVANERDTRALADRAILFYGG
jgi:hypothetical protein